MEAGRMTSEPVSRCFIAIALVVLLSACSPPTASTDPPEAPVDDKGAAVAGGLVTDELGSALAAMVHETPGGESSPAELRQVLLQLLHRFRDCSSYADNARIRLSYDPPRNDAGQPNHDGQPNASNRVTSETRLTVRFVRPNRLSVEVASSNNRIEVRSDGRDLMARIEDAATQNFGGQISRLPCPSTVSVDDIYAVTEYADPSRPESLTSILAGVPLHLHQSQLGMLLPAIPLEQMVPRDAIIERVANQKIGSTVCVRLRVTAKMPGAEAPLRQASTYWIAPDTQTIRRIELPTAGMYEHRPKESRPTNVQLVLDLDESVFDGAIADSVFAMPVSNESRFVRYFVVPPLPLPSDLFGIDVGELEFATLDKQRERSSHWEGKHAVLVWFDGHEESRRILGEIERAFQQFKAHRDRVVFRAICVDDPGQTSDRQVRARLNDWRVSFPAARDVSALGRDVFKIDAAPSIVVYGADQKVHLFSVGVDPKVAENTSVVLQSLLQGTDVGAGVLEQFDKEKQQFRRQLAIASVDRPDSLESAKAVVAPRSAPKHLEVAEVWKSAAAKSPGNLLSVQSDNGQVETFVVDGLREIVKLNDSGNEIDRFQPQLAPDDLISQLQTFTTRAGKKYFATWSTLGKCVYVFDESMQLLFKYPQTDQDYPGIQDVLVADLDSDEDVEVYVSFRDPVGLHRVSSQGKRIWSNRRVTGIASISQDPAGFGRLLTCGDDGAIHPVFFSDGRSEKSIVIAGRTIHRLVKSVSRSSRPTQMMGMSFTLEGRLIAIGMNRNLQEQWSYGLPNGIYQSQVQTPISVSMLEGNPLQWLLAGPDGSVHLVSDDGTFFDTFNSGFNVTGLTGYRLQDAERESSRLLLSTDDSVRAYRIKKSAQ